MKHTLISLAYCLVKAVSVISHTIRTPRSYELRAHGIHHENFRPIIIQLTHDNRHAAQFRQFAGAFSSVSCHQRILAAFYGMRNGRNNTSYSRILAFICLSLFLIKMIFVSCPSAIPANPPPTGGGTPAPTPASSGYRFSRGKSCVQYPDRWRTDDLLSALIPAPHRLWRHGRTGNTPFQAQPDRKPFLRFHQLHACLRRGYEQAHYLFL